MVTTRARLQQLRRLCSRPGSRNLIQLWLNHSGSIPSLSLEIVLQDLTRSARVQTEFCAFLLEFVQGPECEGLLIPILMLFLWLGPDSHAMIGHVAQLFDDLCEESGFVELDQYNLLEIVQSPFLFVRYESTIVAAIERWIQYDPRRRAASFECFLEYVHWSRWRAVDCVRISASSADLQRCVQRNLDRAPAAEAPRFRTLTMAIPLPGLSLHTAVLTFRMASCRWEATLRPDSYKSAGRQRFYRLLLRVLSGPSSSLPVQARIRFSESAEPHYDADWTGFGDVNEVPVFPINRLGASLSGLVVDDRIRLEFRFEIPKKQSKTSSRTSKN